ncbi:HVO_A0114 family putative DNA-binding protein [Alginatibacterium sediminis]
MIAEQQPQSVTEQAALTGRAVSNVSRTLETLDGLGIVRLLSSGYAKEKNRNGIPQILGLGIRNTYEFKATFNRNSRRLGKS